MSDTAITKMKKQANEEIMNHITTILKVYHNHAAAISSTLKKRNQRKLYAKYGLSAEKGLQSGGHHKDFIKITLIQDTKFHEYELENMLKQETKEQKTDIV